MGRKLNPNSDAWGGAWAGAWSGAWGESWRAAQEAIAVAAGGGGAVGKGSRHPWIHFPKLPEELEATLRLKPEIVDAVIEAVAVAEALPDTTEADAFARAELELRRFLEEQSLAWEIEYAQLIRLEYERRALEEEMQVMMLLFEL